MEVKKLNIFYITHFTPILGICTYYNCFYYIHLGILMRPESTGFGAVYFADEVHQWTRKEN